MADIPKTLPPTTTSGTIGAEPQRDEHVPTILGWPRTQPTLAVGPGLCLRPFVDADVDDILAAHQDGEHLRWIPVQQPYTRQKAERFALGVSAEMWAEESGCSFAIADTTTNALLGSVGVPFIDHSLKHAEVGYWVAPWARGRGVATASLRALSRWLLDEVELLTLTLHVQPENHASLAVARNAGYEQRQEVDMDVLGDVRTFVQFALDAHQTLELAEPDWLSTDGKPHLPRPTTPAH